MSLYFVCFCVHDSCAENPKENGDETQENFTALSRSVAEQDWKSEDLWTGKLQHEAHPWDAVLWTPLSLLLKVFSDTLKSVENSLICGISTLRFPWWLSQVFSKSEGVGKCNRGNISEGSQNTPPRILQPTHPECKVTTKLQTFLILVYSFLL